MWTGQNASGSVIQEGHTRLAQQYLRCGRITVRQLTTKCQWGCRGIKKVRGSKQYDRREKRTCNRANYLECALPKTNTTYSPKRTPKNAKIVVHKEVEARLLVWEAEPGMVGNAA